ncbi:hypothetical protein COEX109129_06295 [Corallococcus exiguus]
MSSLDNIYVAKLSPSGFETGSPPAPPQRRARQGQGLFDVQVVLEHPRQRGMFKSSHSHAFPG